MTNPYAASRSVVEQRGVYGDHATLRRSFFLYRVIELQAPLRVTFVYDGWWLRQKITINGVVAWFRISWLTIFRKAEFAIPLEVDTNQPTARMEIGFSRGLMIRRFRLWIDDQIVYDEVN